MTDASSLIPLVFRPQDGRHDIEVQLELETFRPLIGEIRLASPELAARVEAAGQSRESPIITLRDGEVSVLAAAARVLRESQLVDDRALEQLAEL